MNKDLIEIPRHIFSRENEDVLKFDEVFAKA